MFGKMGDMMAMLSKLKETQKKVEAVKKELETQYLEEHSNNKVIFVKVTVSGKIDTILIKDHNLSTQEIQLLLKQTLNSILEKAKTQYEQELGKYAMEGLPDLFSK